MDVRRRFLDDYVEGSGGSGGSYTLTLNSQWQKSTTVSNPDSTLYDGVYESYSNYNVNSGVAIMYIDITGYSNFKLYIRSYGESNYDYVMVSQLDQTITGSSSYSDTSLVKAHTRGNQQSGTAISNYTLVEFTNIDGGSHRITVLYRKDGSVNSGTDKGYLFIPKSQVSDDSGDSGGGDVDIDTTYSITYTSTDGNIVAPYRTTGFGASIISNTYIDGRGIITFNVPVTSIGEWAFRRCTSLTSVTIPDSVTSIGNSAFYECASLTSVTIGDSVTSIENYAFSDCSVLTSITIPDSVTSIGEDAFSDCTSLTSVTIGNSVTSIGKEAFTSCKGLTRITIPDSVTQIGVAAFRDCNNMTMFYGKFASADNRCLIVNGILIGFAPSGLTSITIPNGVTSIGESTFARFQKLTSVIIPNSVTSIGERAFQSCSGLTSMTIPDDVTSIGQYAFNYCTKLTNITIPDDVTSIGSMAFCDCTRLTSVYCKPTTPPAGGSAMFNQNASGRKIYVPTASVDVYKAASGWSTYANDIVGYDF